MTPLLSLMRLVSPALPVGGYCYSRGLEQAVETGAVRDEASASDWIQALLTRSLARVDAPILARMHHAFRDADTSEVTRLSQLLLALRESSELIAEDRNMGEALGRLLIDLGHDSARSWIQKPSTSFVTLFALTSWEWGITDVDAVAGYLFVTCESQMSAAVRLIPLGQTAGQRLLQHLSTRIPAVVQSAMELAEEDFGGFMPGLAMASAHHEEQYSRLFRS